MTLFAFDTETYLIRPGRLAPRLVCVQSREGGIELREDGLDRVERALDDRRLIVGHNTSFDVAVTIVARPRLLEKWIAAYDADLVTCTMVREKLIRIAEGRDFGSYSLLTCVDAYKLPHDFATGDKSGEGWRLRYSELDGIPVEQWPADANRYAMADTIVEDLYYAQAKSARYLADEFRQARAALWLHLMSCGGMTLDQKNVEALRARLTAERDEKRMFLAREGLLTPKGSRKTKKAAELIESTCAALGHEVPRTAKGNVKTDADTCASLSHPALVAFARYTTLTTMLRRCERLAAATIVQPRYNVLVKSGRTSTSIGDRDGSTTGDQVQNLPRERGLRECYRARPGYVLCSVDWTAAELHSLAQVCVGKLGLQSELARVLNARIDPHLHVACTLRGWRYEDALARKSDPDVKYARQAGKCFHPDVEVLCESGWVKVSELTLQDRVAVPIIEDGCVARMEGFEHPLALTYRDDQEIVRIQNEGVDLRCTPDHKISGWGQGTNRRREVPATKIGDLRYWPNAVQWSGGSLRIEENLLRLLVATQADGSYDGNRVRFGFSKQRKINRLNTIVGRLGYALEWRARKKGTASDTKLPDELALVVRAMLTGKRFPLEWCDLSEKCREIVLEEASYWDSHQSNKAYSYSNTCVHSVEVLQRIATLTGRKTRLVKKPGNDKHSDIYCLTVRANGKSRGGSVVIETLGRGRVYCLTTSSNHVIVRDGGIPIVTQQCLNFGFPGGLGIDKFRLFAFKSYGVNMSKREAYEAKQAWLATYPEMENYFSHINACKDKIVHFMSNRHRGGCRYTSAANSYFQGHTADMAKHAGWELTKARYGGTLHDCRMWAFVHDEFILEVPVEHAHERALEVVRIMEDAGRVWCPDVPVRAVPALSFHWRKEAEEKWLDGKLVPWDAVE